MKNDSTHVDDLPEQVEFTLPDPIEINGQPATDFMLTRQPTGHDLGRHTFADVLDGNVRAMAAVTPKLVSPYLSPAIIKGMSGRNLMAVQQAYNAFFEGVELEKMAKPKTHSTPVSPKPAASAPKGD
ncbi:MAG: phage tail assembly protein [Pseudomonadota bacterium]